VNPIQQVAVAEEACETLAEPRVHGLADKSAAALRVKRAIDVALSALLLVLVLPLFAVIAVAIRLDSQGPIFFSQVRIGQNRRRRRGAFPEPQERRRREGFGREFSILKFRTMHADAPRYARKPFDGSDPRVTRVGRFLRRTCVDELPQLINVLRGEMSLVGPRPEMPFVVRKYDETQRRRLDAVPGITGLWQLNARRDRAIHEELSWDLCYTENWSLWLDLNILWDTIRFVFGARNH
jgi:lipopolysaccharide/colanic/teichoic acid biosynthesis glycosyltransferase